MGLNKDVIGKKVTEVIPDIKKDTPELFDIYGKVALKGEQIRFEIYLDTLKVWVSVVAYSPQPHYFIAVFEDITSRKQAEEELLIYQEQLRSMASELSLVEERERRRIADELHDRICQTLTIAKIRLLDVEQSISSPDHTRVLIEVGKLIEQSIHNTRTLTFELSPPILYELGFAAAIEWFAEQLQEQHNIKFEIKDNGQRKPLDENVSVVLFKVTRELLMNVIKHAQATKVQIAILRTRNDTRIEVKDDGIGFKVPKSIDRIDKTIGYGIFNIKERIRYLGGSFEIKSKPGHGTQAVFTLPRYPNGEKH